MIRDKPWFAVVYMFCVTAFFSFIIIGFAQITKDRVKANEQLAFERAVLEVFDLAEGKAPPQIHQTFIDEVRKEDDGAYYVRLDGDKVEGYAVVVRGKGFWAQIEGVIGVAADKRTITGIAFYEQNETPGLGAEITGPAFGDQFEGLRLGPKERPIGIKPFGAELADNEVHAISGATQTCMRLEKLINNDLTKWLAARAGEDVK